MSDKKNRITHYALRGEDGVYYGLHAFADYRGDVRGEVASKGGALAKTRGAWFRADAEVDAVEITKEPLRSFEGQGYVLYPHAGNVPGMSLSEEITSEEWESAPESIQDLYHRKSVEIPQDPDVVSASEWVWLEGEPPPDDPRVDLWRPNLPAWLKYGMEFSHVFPGVLVGFRTAMKEVVEGIVDGDVYHRENGFQVFASYKYHPPQFHQAKPYPKSRRTVSRESRTMKSIHVNCFERISGDNLADALAKWDRARELLEADVRRQAGVKLCSSCSGKGYVDADPAV